MCNSLLLGRRISSEVNGLPNRIRNQSVQKDPSSTSISIITRLRKSLSTPIDCASLCVFRILFGLVPVLLFVIYELDGSLYKGYIEPRNYFTFVSWVKPLPSEGFHLLFLMMSIFGVLISLGLYYRMAAICFTACLTYTFLLEKTEYQNHTYLLCLFGVLMSCLPANRMFTLDAIKRGRDKSESEKKGDSLADRRIEHMMPGWQLYLLRAQVIIVYFYAAVAKVNPDWLSGWPLRIWLFHKSGLPVVGKFLTGESTAVLFSYTGLILDFGLCVLLLYERTFWLAVILSVTFHVMNACFWNIDVFPFFMTATLCLFARPDWPRRWMKQSRTGTGETIAQYAEEHATAEHAAAERAGEVENGTTGGADARSGDALSGSSAGTKKLCWARSLAPWLAAAYILVQVLLPLRPFLYPGNCSWTEYGLRFSWRMLVRDKQAISFTLTARDPVSGKTSIIAPQSFLTERQIRKMETEPGMILQFAHIVADRVEFQTGRRPEIHVDSDRKSV